MAKVSWSKSMVSLFLILQQCIAICNWYILVHYCFQLLSQSRYLPFSVFTATVCGRGQCDNFLSSCIWGSKWALYTIPNSPGEKRNTPNQTINLTKWLFWTSLNVVYLHPCKVEKYHVNLPCPNVSSSLILLLGISVFPVSSLTCPDITDISVCSLNWGSGSACGGSTSVGSLTCCNMYCTHVIVSAHSGVSKTQTNM